MEKWKIWSKRFNNCKVIMTILIIKSKKKINNLKSNLFILFIVQKGLIFRGDLAKGLSCYDSSG